MQSDNSRRQPASGTAAVAANRHASQQVTRPSQGPNIPIYYENALLTPSQLKALSTRYPFVKFQVSEQASAPHLHPCLAFERKYCEQIVHGEESQTTILDVGGSMRRNSNRPNVWTLAPILSPRDCVAASFQERPLNCCRHKLQDCTCGGKEILLFNHSVYYFTPDEICEAFNDQRLTSERRGYIIYHPFETPMSLIGGDEGEYEVDSDGSVRMRIQGASGYFHHSACHWLRNGFYRNGDVAIAWTTWREVGDTVIAQVTACPVGVSSDFDMVKPVNFVAAIEDDSYYGKAIFATAGVHRPKDVPTLCIDELQTAVTWSLGPYLIVATSKVRRMVVPKSLLSTLRRIVVFNLRTTDTLAMLTARAKQMLNNVNAPQACLTDALPFIVATAMVSGLDDELASLKTIRAASSKINRLTNALKLDTTRVIRLRLVPLALVTLGGYCLYDHVPLIQASVPVMQIVPYSIVAPIFETFVVNTVAVPLAEEAVKTVMDRYDVRLPGLSAGATFGVCEFALTAVSLYPSTPFVTILKYRTPALLMHCCTSRAPYLLRVGVHSAFNFLIPTLFSSQVAVASSWTVLGALSLVAFAAYCFAEDDSDDSETFHEFVGSAVNAAKSLWNFGKKIYHYFITDDGDSRPLNRMENKKQTTRTRLLMDANRNHSLPPEAVILQSDSTCDLRPYSSTEVKSGVRFVTSVDTNVKPAKDINPTATMTKVSDSADFADPNAATLVGIDLGVDPPLIPSTSDHNFQVTLRNRLLRLPKEIDVTELSNFYTWTMNNFKTLFNGPARHVNPMPFDQWNARFPTAVQKAHQTALDMIVAVPVDVYKATRVNGFLKMENYVGKFNEGDYDFKSRGISAATREYNVITGPQMAAFTQEMRNRWHPGFFITLNSGLSAESHGFWLTHRLLPGDRHIIEGDFVTFDASTSSYMRELCIDIHDRFGASELCILMQRAKVNKHGTIGNYKFTVEGTMASGDNETYIDNSIVNALITTYAHCRLRPTSMQSNFALADQLRAKNSNAKIVGDARARALLHIGNYKPLRKPVNNVKSNNVNWRARGKHMISVTSEKSSSTSKPPSTMWVLKENKEADQKVSYSAPHINVPTSPTSVNDIPPDSPGRLRQREFIGTTSVVSDISMSNFDLNPSPTFEESYVDQQFSFSILVGGDDNLIVCSIRMVDVKEIVAKLGYELDCEYRSELHDVEFCSQLFWPITVNGVDTFALGPKLGRYFTKVPWAVKLRSPDTNAHVRGVALGYENDLEHVPFAREYNRKILWLTSQLRAHEVVDPFRPHVSMVFESDAHTYGRTMAFVNSRYGLGPESLKSFVQHLRRIKTLPSSGKWPSIDSLIDRDL